MFPRKPDTKVEVVLPRIIGQCFSDLNMTTFVRVRSAYEKS